MRGHDKAWALNVSILTQEHFFLLSAVTEFIGAIAPIILFCIRWFERKLRKQI